VSRPVRSFQAFFETGWSQIKEKLDPGKGGEKNGSADLSACLPFSVEGKVDVLIMSEVKGEGVVE